jgi:hypothetical protein
VVIGTNCIGSHKSNYHTITTTTTNWLPRYNWSIVESGSKHQNPNPKATLSRLSPFN